MLKKRIVATLVVKQDVVVQSIGFSRYLPVGRAEISAEFLNRWGIDEIVLIDIDARTSGRSIDIDLVHRVSENVFVPLTVAGGISSSQEAKKLISNGADRVMINTAAFLRPELISELAEIFGNQAVVVSIDVKRDSNSSPWVFTHCGTKNTGLSPVEWARQVSEYGAGEILLTSIDRDGTKTGYDCPLIRNVSDTVTVPIIACGGVGHPKHFIEGITKGHASAVAAGNFFHFTEHSSITTKAFLRQHNVDIRLDTYATYEGITFQRNGRIDKWPEDYLNRLRFEYIADEVI